MTIEDLKALAQPTLTPKQVSEVIGCDPHTLRLMARRSPELIGFPVIVIGTRTKIPREPFIKFLEG